MANTPSQNGFIILHRSLIGHPAFRDLSEEHAFIRMIAQAAWKPITVRYKGRMIPLERGQLALSVRDLSRKMRWSKGKTERFLKCLANEDMVRTDMDHKLGRITICNYDKYQGLQDTVGTPANADRGQGEDTVRTPTGTQNNKVKQDNKVNKEGSSRRARDLDAFVLDEKDRKWAAENYPSVDADSVLENLQNYCAAHGKKYADYRAAWRQFMKTEKSRGKRNSGSQSPHEALYAGFSSAAARLGEGAGNVEGAGDRPCNSGGNSRLPTGDGPGHEASGAEEDNGPDGGFDGPLLDAKDA